MGRKVDRAGADDHVDPDTRRLARDKPDRKSNHECHDGAHDDRVGTNRGNVDAFDHHHGCRRRRIHGNRRDRRRHIGCSEFVQRNGRRTGAGE